MSRTEELQNGAKLTQAEQELFYWQYNRAGSFITNLFVCIGKADTINRYKLSLGFPDEVHAFVNYSELEGFWEALEKRMIKDKR